MRPPPCTGCRAPRRACGSPGRCPGTRPARRASGVAACTINPNAAREIGADLAARGIEFLDAPVSGGVEGARNGKLSVMAGGSEADLALISKARGQTPTANDPRDANGDGRADIIFRRTTDGTVYIWLMNGGTIASQGVISNPGAQWLIADLADMDGDGKPDMVVANQVDNNVQVSLGQGGGAPRGRLNAQS